MNDYRLSDIFERTLFRYAFYEHCVHSCNMNIVCDMHGPCNDKDDIYVDVIYMVILMSFALYMFQSSKFWIQCGYPLYVCLLLCICFNLTNFGFKFENKLKKRFFKSEYT
jgi:hypothetical protein